MTMGERIEYLRKKQGLTLDELGSKLGLQKSAVKKYETGRVENIKRGTIKKMAEIFGVDPAYLMFGGDESSARVSQQKLVPVLGTVQCGPNGLAEEEPDGYEPADVQNVDEYFYLRAKGDSMEPYIREGDYVLAHKQEDIESGELAVVVVGGEEGTLKKVLKQSNSVILQPFNNNCPTRVFVGKECDDLRIVGKVVETKHKW